MIPIIKICGITRAEDLALCEELGVEMIGLNFVPSSPRRVTVAQAKKLRSAVKQCGVIGVFQDQSDEEVQKIAEEVGLDGVQVYGSEKSPLRPDGTAEGQGRVNSEKRRMNVETIKAFRSVPEEPELREWMGAGARVLFDGRANGVVANWDAMARLPEDIRSQMILAGGLTPENVQEAIQIVRPYGVDIASGVESEPGVKDAEKVKKFVERVRSVKMIRTRTP